ncbi:type 2 periplasmic-binding domain-containing protein [Krasilnikoviella flava]|uniref:hypothetical protein n=1 Tax=Krasilnikoviella flava TaxID=526729 RepID=UPI0009A5EFA5|nr:hypothetical protein [Krasilnikoviella flava]
MGRPYGDLTCEGMPVVYRPIADDLPANALVRATPKGGRPTAKRRALRSLCDAGVGEQVPVGPGEPNSRVGRLS